MNRCGVSSAARYQCTRNHNYNVTFVCQTALQSQFFTQTVEIISRSDLFNQLRHNAFAQYQLMSRFSLVVSAGWWHPGSIYVLREQIYRPE